METTHQIHVEDARSMDALDDESVDLVVTSPPYPMVEMWDDLFSDLDPRVADRLDAGAGVAAFELMHDALDPVWEEVARVLAPGGIACINVGDAVRSVGDGFRQYSNHVEITRRVTGCGLSALPDVLWRKPVNSTNKFLGSGTIPTNAYVTLEHEYVLIFRKGQLRKFPPGDRLRYESAFFWEERNEWFSDLWEDVQGVGQTLDETDLRERSGAFPFEIPYRLICMYSVYGDTVLDPFWGTGTTSLAAMVAARNSVGYELKPEFGSLFKNRIEDVSGFSRMVLDQRLDDHEAFVAAHNGGFSYEALTYDVPVKTKQEREIQFYAVDHVRNEANQYNLTHTPYPTR